MEILSTTIFPSWLLTTILLVLSIFFIFLYTLRFNRSSMAVPKLPPSPPKLPIIGNLHQLLGKPQYLALSQLSQEYGPIMLLHIGTKPFLIISSSAMAKQIFRTYDHVFCSRAPSQATKRLSYNYLDAAFSPHSSHWRVMRKILVSEFLGPRRVRLFNHELMTEIEAMVHSISLHPSNSALNLTNVLFALVKKVVCKVAFGNNYEEEPQMGQPSKELNQLMLNEMMELLNGSVGDSFPAWLGRIISRVSGTSGKLDKCFGNVDAYIEMIINAHHNQSNVEKSDLDKDFVHTLLELSSMENASNYRLTKEEVKALILNILTGAIDTTAVTTVWAMTEIVRSARVMEKLQNEIRNCVGVKQKLLHDIDNTKMTYLKMVVKETLRLHPPAPLLLPHESLSHCQVSDYDVSPGTSAIINAWWIGRDPSTWGENASEFYPERFEKLEADVGGGNFEMVPFGGGRRACPAMNTAPATIELTIANLLYWFDWGVPGGMKNEDLNMEEEGYLVIRKKLPLYLVPTRHNW